MLRKVLTITIVAVLFISLGCKKAAPPPKQVTIPNVQKQVEGAGQKAAKEAEAAKEKAGQEIEKAGKEIQKDANAQAQ